MPKITIEQLAEQINHEVRFAAPIGSSNIKEPSSEERTAGWSDKMVKWMKDGLRDWDKTASGEWRTVPGDSIHHHLPSHIDGYDDSEVYRVNLAVLGAIYKSGNCREMAALGFIRACYIAQRALNGNDAFSFKLISANTGTGKNKSPTLDHSLLVITLGSESLICDPWLNHLCKITDEDIQDLRSRLEKAWNKKIPEGEWTQFIDLFNSPAQVEIHSPDQAKKILDLYENHFNKCLEYLPLKEAIDNKNLLLFSHHDPSSVLEEQKNALKSPKDDSSHPKNK